MRIQRDVDVKDISMYHYMRTLIDASSFDRYDGLFYATEDNLGEIESGYCNSYTATNELSYFTDSLKNCDRLYVSSLPNEEDLIFAGDKGVKQIVVFSKKDHTINPIVAIDIFFVEDIEDRLLTINGVPRQLWIVAGELSELIGQISNAFNRVDRTNGDEFEKLLGEIVDVEIQLSLLKTICYNRDSLANDKLKAERLRKHVKLFKKFGSIPVSNV